MKREPEPELMSEKEQVIAYDKGDFSLSEDVFVSFIGNFLNTHNISLNKGDLVVDLGCGPGNITKKIAIKWPHIRLLGIDGSNEMILRAKHNLNSNGKKNDLANVDYICEEIKNIQLSDIAPLGNIKMLVSNSLIHHLTNIDDFFDCIEKLSTSITINFHKDLKRPKNKYTAIALRNICASKYDDTLTRDYYASLKASYSISELEQIIFKRKLISMEVVEDGNEHLMVYGKVYN